MAVCLSGGGFRASLFHLGALRRLHELGVLKRVTAISSVSGGSIFAGFLAHQAVALGRQCGTDFADWQKEVADPFRAFAARDLRTLLVLLHLPWNWLWPRWRVRHLEARYRKRLTGLVLRELPSEPEFILCATDLVFGVNWEFRREYAGDYQAGYSRAATQWPLARAIAASSSFPPIFGPLKLGAKPSDFSGGKYSGADRGKLVPRIGLSDGGVYDNMGLEPVWDDYEYVLVSDCGAPFGFRVGSSPVRRLLRYTSVVTNQTRALRLRALFAQIREGKHDGCYWAITQGLVPGGMPAEGYSQGLVEEVISKVRTDLDNFSEAEMSVLENHGYFAADRKLRKYVPELVALGSHEAKAPYPGWMNETRVREALKNSHRRFLPRRLVASWWGEVRRLLRRKR